MKVGVIRKDTTLQDLRAHFSDLEKTLRLIGYGSLGKLMATLPNSGCMTIGCLARAAGLTELEIGIIVADLNEKLIPDLPGNEGNSGKIGRKVA